MDATELFLKSCKDAGADPDAILAFGMRKLKKVGPPKVSEHKVAIGKVVGGDAADDAVAVAEAVKAADVALDSDTHFVLKTPLRVLDDTGGGGPDRTTIERAVFATGCFWGAEKGFWRLPSVYSTAAAYVAESDCQVEVVQVFYDTNCIKYADLLRWFWQCHDPTQVDGQGECVRACNCLLFGCK